MKAILLILIIYSCGSEKRATEPIQTFTYWDLAMYVRVIDGAIERTTKDSAEYMMEYDRNYCGGTDTILTNSKERLTRFHNPDSCAHTRHI